MRIAWLLLAEGIAQDAKGAFSLIEVNQNLVFVGATPTQTKRALFVHLEGEPGELPDRDLSNASFVFTILSPSNVTVSAQSGQIQASGLPFPELPASADIPFDVVIPVTELGEYKLGFRIVYAGGRTEEQSVSLYALSAVENPQFRELREAQDVQS